MRDGNSVGGGWLRNIVWNLRTATAILLSIVLIWFSQSEWTAQYPVVATIAHEVGFALIVALVIWGVYEYFSHEATESQWTARIDRISKNVFLGVFRRNFPEALLREASSLLLDQQLLREGFSVTYTLLDGTFEISPGVQSPFVELHAVARYKVRNISNSAAESRVAIGLPNPIHPKLKEYSKVKSVRIRRNAEAEPQDLAEAEARFRADLADDSRFVVMFSLPSVVLQPNDAIEIVWDYRMAKEEEDSEIFQTMLPVESVNITIMDRNPEQRTVRARSVHPAPLENNTPADAVGSYHYRLDRFFLPHQGFVIWWKRKLPPRVN